MTTMMKVQADRAGRSLVRRAALPGPTHPTQELASDDDDPAAAADDEREDDDDGCESMYPLHLRARNDDYNGENANDRGLATLLRIFRL